MSGGENRWDELIDSWQAESGAYPAERRMRSRVRRQTLGMWLVAGLEVLLTIALLLWSFEVVLSGTDAFEAATLVTLWTFWAIAAVYAYTNRRGSWGAVDESTLAYVKVSLGRARRRLRTAWFVLWLLAAEVVAVVSLVGWRQKTAPVGAGVMGSALGLLVVLCAAYVGWALWTRRRATREIDHLSRLLEELEHSDSGEDPSDL